MKLSFFEEPELQFGSGLHLDNKFGLLNLGPFDLREKRRPEKILIGLVGSPTSNSGVKAWFKRIEQGVPAKASKKPNLFPRFPSVAEGMPFRSEFVFDPSLQVDLQTRDYVTAVSSVPEGIERLQALAEVFVSRAKALQDKGANIAAFLVAASHSSILGKNSPTPAKYVFLLGCLLYPLHRDFPRVMVTVCAVGSPVGVLARTY